MRYLIDHTLTITFSQPVREHHCELRLAPPENSAQRVHALRIATEPAAQVATYVDYFGNPVHHFSVIAPHAAVEVLLQADVETLLSNPFDYALVPAAQEREWIARALTATPRLWDYVLHRSDLVPDPQRLPDLEWPRYETGRSVCDLVTAAGVWAASLVDFAADAAPQDGLQAALEARVVPARDLAHLVIAAVRAWGLPARFVSGYTDPQQADDSDAPPAPAQHAWAEVLIPGAGWRGFDAVHGLVANDAYITVAVGRDAAEAAPCRSSFKGGDERETRAMSLRVKRTHDQ
jgi:transglutaminase-like putative cysteine protease